MHAIRLAVLFCAATLVACSNVALDDALQGKACDFDGSCAPGYVCDEGSNVCVPIDGSGGATTSAAGGVGGVGAGGAAAGGSGGMVSTGGAPPEGTFYPSDDSFVNVSAPTQNNGSQPLLQIYATSGLDAKSTFLKFDLTGASTTAIQQATLYLTVSGNDCKGSIVEVADDGWKELTITAANAPAFGSAVGETLITPGTLVVDATEYVRRELAGDGIVSFAIWSGTPVDTTMRSKEHGIQAEWPRLELR